MMNSRILMILAVVSLLTFCLIRNTEARPNYSKVFETAYESEYTGKGVKTNSCTICHDQAKDKKNQNNYGEAMVEFLRTRNKKDEVEVRAALKETEQMPSAIEGKTFGDLIKEGRLPASR